MEKAAINLEKSEATAGLTFLYLSLSKGPVGLLVDSIYALRQTLQIRRKAP